MRGFKVEINGKRLCVAGVGADDILSVITTYVGSRAHGSSLDLSISGLFTETEEHAIWKRVNLKVGDKVVVKVIETDSIDKPVERYRPDSKTAERNQKAYLRAWAKKFGWKIVARPLKKSK